MKKKVWIWALVSCVPILCAIIILSIFLLNKNSEKSTAASSKEIENLKIGLTWMPELTYPKCSSENTVIVLNSRVYEPLVSFDKKNTLRPRLAEKWDNPNELTWRFYISPKAVFSDGTAVKADDVKFTYELLTSEKYPASELLPEIERLEIVDKNTIQFITKEPNPVFANRLTTFLILSKAAYENSNQFVGSGSYVLGVSNNEKVIIKRNERYWGEKPQVKQITYTTISDEKERVKALLAGDIDVASYTADSSKIISAAIDSGALYKNKIPYYNSVEYLVLDTSRTKSPGIALDSNPLKDLKVRQAIYKAININSVISSMGIEANPATQLVPEEIFGYNPEIKRPDYNLEEAKQLLAEAGYPNGFEVRFDFHSMQKNDDLVSSIKQELAKINIILTPCAYDDINAYYEKVDSRETSLYKSGYASDSKDAGEVLSLQIHSPKDNFGIYNLTYENTEADSLIEEAAKTMNPADRLKLLRQAQKIAIDEVAVIPLYEAYELYAYRSNLSWTPRADGSIIATEFELAN